MKGRWALRQVGNDIDYRKTLLHERPGTAMGDPGCLSIFGRKAVQHRLFAEHVTSEYRVRTEGRSRTVDEPPTLHSYGDWAWKLPAHKPDNHWFDCVVGCAGAASMRGVEHTDAKGAHNSACEQASKRVAGPQAESAGRDRGVARNHWFDCVVGRAGAAFTMGVSLRSASSQLPSRRLRLKLSELQPSRQQVGPPVRLRCAAGCRTSGSSARRKDEGASA